MSTDRPFLGISVFNEVLESHDTWCTVGDVHKVVCRAESARSEPDAGVTSSWAPMSRSPLCRVLDFPTCCPRRSYWIPFRYGSFIPYEIGEYGNTILKGCTVTTSQGDCFENWSVVATTPPGIFCNPSRNTFSLSRRPALVRLRGHTFPVMPRGIISHGTKRLSDSFALTLRPYVEDVNSLPLMLSVPSAVALMLPSLASSKAMHKTIGGQTIIQTHPHAHGFLEFGISTAWVRMS